MVGLKREAQKSKPKKGPVVALNQVKATYQADIPKNWIMPYRYYVLYSNTFKVVFFVLDSNTFLWDKDQKTWFDNVYTHFQGENLTQILIMHHPLLAIGKPEDKLHMYNNFYGKKDKEPIGKLIADEFRNINPDIKFNLLLCAHDHFSDVRNLNSQALNDQLLQCISGSVGFDRAWFETFCGGALEPSGETADTRAQKCLAQYDKENVNLYKRNACVLVTLDKEKNISLQFIEPSTFKPLCVFNLVDSVWLLMKGAHAMQLMAEENNDFKNFVRKLIAKKEEDKPLRDIKKLAAFISYSVDLTITTLTLLREDLILTYLVTDKTRFGSNYRTYYVDKNVEEFRSCSEEWRNLEYLISSKILYLAAMNSLKFEPNQIKFCESYFEKIGPCKFVSAARTATQIGPFFTDMNAKNKTYIAFKTCVNNGDIAGAAELARLEWNKMIHNFQLNPADFPIVLDPPENR